METRNYKRLVDYKTRLTNAMARRIADKKRYLSVKERILSSTLERVAIISVREKVERIRSKSTCPVFFGGTGDFYSWVAFEMRKHISSICQDYFEDYDVLRYIAIMSYATRDLSSDAVAERYINWMLNRFEINNSDSWEIIANERAKLEKEF